MKICTAQIRPLKGNILKNIEQHKKLINLAAANGADIIFFPELSLTGYEPKLAKELATIPLDNRLDDFQNMSDLKNITIGVGLPLNNIRGILISMVIFQPGKSRQIYSKQHLHEDELPYFVNGEGKLMLRMDNTKLAPAICYESLLPEHSKEAFENGAEIYLASVAKSANGIAKAYKHYPEVARKYGMIVLMSNCVGQSDDFESVGKSAIWNSSGTMVGAMDEVSEGMLMIDTETEAVFEWTL